MTGIILPFDRTDTEPLWQGIYTYEGWREYVNAPQLEKPRLPTLQEYRALPEMEREALDLERMRYALGFGPLKTPALEKVSKVVKNELRVNLGAPADQVKGGVVIDGHASYGKTTIAKTIARQYELMIRSKARFADASARDLFIPVVHVTLQRNTSPKAMALAVCRYLNVPLRGRETEDDLVRAIYDAVPRHRILMFVIDDIHFLRARSKEGQETSNFLKSLMSLTGATFLYVGIDVEKMGILQEHGVASLVSSQTASRFKRAPVLPFGKEDSAWRSLLRKIEGQLCLLDQTPGTFEGCYKLIYNRTGGSIGTLMNLMRNAAVEAIGGTERITVDDLRSVDLDYAATKQGGLEDS